jgi:hypothetical protein
MAVLIYARRVAESLDALRAATSARTSRQALARSPQP